MDTDGHVATSNTTWTTLPTRTGHNAHSADNAEVINNHGDDNVDTDVSEVSETELNLEFQFLDFIAQSAAHRKDRDAKKRLAEKKRQTGNYATAPNPTEAPGLARRRQYAQLYGESDSDSIQLVEARMNLAHDKAVDTHAPKLWPALPLRM